MAEVRPLPPQYDRVAHLYDVDMARNMAFDDVGFYLRACKAHAGRVLELGCGNGRILLALQAQGIDAVGVDGSARMLHELARKAAAQRLPLRACRMDVRRLAFDPRFDVILCPYSLITYMAAPGDARRMLDECRRVLAPRGVVIVDAFVPRPFATSSGFVRDYERGWGEGTVVRSKRLSELAPGVNRIERRYEVRGAGGELQELIETTEDIRPFAPDALVALLSERGFRVGATWWNYASTAMLPDAQFFTVVASPAAAR